MAANLSNRTANTVEMILAYRAEMAEQLLRMPVAAWNDQARADRVREIAYCNQRLKTLGYLPADCPV